MSTRKPENVRAANKYLIMMQIACAATMVGAELLAVTGKSVSGSLTLKYDFDAVERQAALLVEYTPGHHCTGFRDFSWSALESRWACGLSVRSGCRMLIQPLPRPSARCSPE